MKFQIEGQKEEPTLTFSLKREEDTGIIQLIVQEDTGFKWIILAINPDGTLTRYKNCFCPGLVTDTDGRIKLREELDVPSSSFYSTGRELYRKETTNVNSNSR